MQSAPAVTMTALTTMPPSSVPRRKRGALDSQSRRSMALQAVCCTEAPSLLEQRLAEIEAVDALWESRILLDDVGRRDLTTRDHPLKDHHAPSDARRIDRRR